MSRPAGRSRPQGEMHGVDGRMPLEGVRILDLSNLIAGPMTTMYLADFGAEVFKVEHPVRGDELRSWGHSKDGVGLFFKVVNRNKRAITLDLKRPEGQALVRRLAEAVDVIVESFRPGTLARWGIGYEDLRDVNPDLVMVSVSGYGQTGPYASRPGFGTVAEAFSGYAAITGYADRPPLLPAFGLADAATAIHGAYAIMLALYHRDVHGGGGQHIDLALYEGLFTLLGPHVIDFDQLGIVQERSGGRLPFVSPRNSYRTGDDQWLALAGSTQATFERICAALGLEHVVDDPRFATNRLRIEHASELDAIIDEALSGFTADEALRRLEKAGAVAGPVNDVAKIVADPHVRARGSLAEVDDDELGTVRMQSVVPRLSDAPGAIRHAAPPKGRDNRAVYGELLGLGDRDLDELAANHVI